MLLIPLDLNFHVSLFDVGVVILTVSSVRVFVLI